MIKRIPTVAALPLLVCKKDQDGELVVPVRELTDKLLNRQNFKVDFSEYRYTEKDLKRACIAGYLIRAHQKGFVNPFTRQWQWWRLIKKDFDRWLNLYQNREKS